MVVGDIATGTDVVVIGAGPGGYTAAIRAAMKGKDVVVIERDEVGGVCLNHGCIPAKALIHAAGFREDIDHWNEIGIETGEVEVDFDTIQEWKDGVVKRLDDGVKQLMDHYGAELMYGEAEFIDNTTLRVEKEHKTEKINFEEAIIATGSRPIEVPGLEFDGDRVISSREMLEIDEVPDEIVVIGGGYIGMEAVTKFGKFGSKVKVVEVQDRVLPHFQEEVVDEIQETNSDYYGEKIHTSTSAKNARYEGDKVIVEAEKEGEELEITGNYVLVAVGRETRPVLENLGVENTDVEIDEDGFVEVDEQMKTDAGNIFAIGDAVGQPMLAHKAYREGKVAADVIAGEPAAFDNQYIPQVMYTDPEVATVGMTEKEAREEFDEVLVGRFPFSASGRSLTTNHDEGFIKVIASGDEKLQGATIVGERASDMIAEATLALEMQAYLDDVANTIHAHPTFPESFADACEAAKNESTHTF
jgi:dihydrolipoamide dehydrogenase